MAEILPDADSMNRRWPVFIRLVLTHIFHTISGEKTTRFPLPSVSRYLRTACWNQSRQTPRPYRRISLHTGIGRREIFFSSRYLLRTDLPVRQETKRVRTQASAVINQAASQFPSDDQTGRRCVRCANHGPRKPRQLPLLRPEWPAHLLPGA